MSDSWLDKPSENDSDWSVLDSPFRTPAQIVEVLARNLRNIEGRLEAMSRKLENHIEGEEGTLQTVLDEVRRNTEQIVKAEEAVKVVQDVLVTGRTLRKLADWLISLWKPLAVIGAAVAGWWWHGRNGGHP